MESQGAGRGGDEGGTESEAGGEWGCATRVMSGCSFSGSGVRRGVYVFGLGR